MCPPGHYHNGFVATHALGHIMYVRLGTVRFEFSVCRGSPMTIYREMYIVLIYQVFMPNFLRENVRIFPLYILLTRRIKTFWSACIEKFWSVDIKTFWVRKVTEGCGFHQ